METNEPKLTMTAEELFELHPLPWTHHLLLIKDVNDRQVIHTGGLYSERGELHKGEYLSGLNALLVEFVNSRNNTSDSARLAAEEIAEWMNWKKNIPQISHQQNIVSLTNMLSKYFAAAPVEKSPSDREEWRQGMKDAAKEVCDACADEYQYGATRKIKGSTRWWHGEHADFQCEAGGIWHALAHAATAAPADNDAESLPLSRAIAVCKELAEHVTQELIENSDHPQRDILNYDDYRKGQVQAALEIESELRKLTTTKGDR